MTEISGRRATARIQAGCRVAGNSRATTSGFSRTSAWRTSTANSRRPGATGKYVKRPLWRLPALGIGRSVSSGIPQGLFPQDLDDGDFERFGLVRLPGGQAPQLDGEPRHVDAIARGIAFIGGVCHLQ